MDNKELKNKIWSKLRKKYAHLYDFCTINLRGIDNDEQYFHPSFIINDDVSITSQCDTTNKHIYAIRFNWISKGISIEINDDLLSAIIIGFHTNKESVELAMDTMAKVRNHINTLNNYTNDYITNILIGNSVNEVTDSFINELKANQKLISFMQKSNK
jgi:hypothetical protein